MWKRCSPAAVSAPKRQFEVSFQLADAEDLPFAVASFDAVVSTFGGMFSPDQDRYCRRIAASMQVRGPDRPRQLDA